MSIRVKDINIKNYTYYYFIDIIINIIQIILKQIISHKKYFIYYNGYVGIKDSKYVKINSVNPLHLIFSKVIGCFEEIYKNNYLILVPANESNEIIKKIEELWIKITDLITSKTQKIMLKNK